jgi:gluconokinase
MTTLSSNKTITGLRSPRDKVCGLVFFGRMLDKIRLQAAGKLPEGYHVGDENPGWFDARCVRFLGVRFADLSNYVLTHQCTDEEALSWCWAHGRKPTDEEVMIWNTFLTKRGWNDEGSEGLQNRKIESGMTDRADIQTFFDYIEADEGMR